MAERKPKLPEKHYPGYSILLFSIVFVVVLGMIYYAFFSGVPDQTMPSDTPPQTTATQQAP